jgi:hypothetical protein
MPGRPVLRRFHKESEISKRKSVQINFKLNLESYLHEHARVCASKCLLGLPNFALYLPKGLVMKFVKLKDRIY